MVLIGGAVVAAAALSSRHRGAEAHTAPTTPPPPAVSSRMDLPVVVIGADCAVLGAAAVDQTGAAAYCARGASEAPDSPGSPVWSLQPDTMRAAANRPSP